MSYNRFFKLRKYDSSLLYRLESLTFFDQPVQKERCGHEVCIPANARLEELVELVINHTEAYESLLRKHQALVV